MTTPTPPAGNPVNLTHAARDARAVAKAKVRGELLAEYQKAMDTLKESTKRIPTLITGVLIIGTAIANTPGMGDVAANWTSIAKDLEVYYPGIIGNAVLLSRADWQADDRQAFLDAAVKFGSQLQKLSGICYTLADKVSALRQAYYDYWIGVIKVAGMVVAYIGAANMMRRFNVTSAAAGELALHRFGTIVSSRIAQMTMLLGAFLKEAGSALGAVIAKMTSMNNIKPTGYSKIDFHSAEFRVRIPSEWLAPNRQIGAPYKNDPDPAADKAIDEIKDTKGPKN